MTGLLMLAAFLLIVPDMKPAVRRLVALTLAWCAAYVEVMR
jgi:hypothetical protein